jgi:hypothetical protein
MRLTYPRSRIYSRTQSFLKSSLLTVIMSLLVGAAIILSAILIDQRQPVLLPVLIYIIAMGIYLLTHPKRQARAGKLLVSLYQPRTQAFQISQAVIRLLFVLLMTVLVVISYAMYAIVAINEMSVPLFQLVFTILALLWIQGMYMLFIGWNQPEFRERGIWLNLRLVKWDSIRSYGWKRSPKNTYRLDLETKWFWRSRWRSIFPIAPVNKSMIDQVLAEKLSSD